MAKNKTDDTQLGEGRPKRLPRKEVLSNGSSKELPDRFGVSKDTPFDMESSLGVVLRDVGFKHRDLKKFCPQYLKVGMLTPSQGKGLNKLLETLQQQEAFRVVISPSGRDHRQVKVTSHTDAVRWLLEQIDAAG